MEKTASYHKAGVQSRSSCPSLHKQTYTHLCEQLVHVSCLPVEPPRARVALPASTALRERKLRYNAGLGRKYRAVCVCVGKV